MTTDKPSISSREDYEEVPCIEINGTVCSKQDADSKNFSWKDDWMKLKKVAKRIKIFKVNNKYIWRFVASLVLFIDIIANIVDTVDYYKFAYKEKSRYYIYHNHSGLHLNKNLPLDSMTPSYIQSSLKLSQSYFFCALGVWIGFPVIITIFGYGGDKYGPMAFLIRDIVGNNKFLERLEDFLKHKRFLSVVAHIFIILPANLFTVSVVYYVVIPICNLFVSLCCFEFKNPKLRKLTSYFIGIDQSEDIKREECALEEQKLEEDRDTSKEIKKEEDDDKCKKENSDENRANYSPRLNAFRKLDKCLLQQLGSEIWINIILWIYFINNYDFAMHTEKFLGLIVSNSWSNSLLSLVIGSLSVLNGFVSICIDNSKRTVHVGGTEDPIDRKYLGQLLHAAQEAPKKYFKTHWIKIVIIFVILLLFVLTIVEIYIITNYSVFGHD